MKVLENLKLKMVVAQYGLKNSWWLIFNKGIKDGICNL